MSHLSVSRAVFVLFLRFIFMVFFNFACVWVCFAFMYVCTTCGSGVHGRQKKAWDSSATQVTDICQGGTERCGCRGAKAGSSVKAASAEFVCLFDETGLG